MTNLLLQSLVSDNEQLFPKTTSRGPEKKITKLEARWLPRRGYNLEGYPHTLLLIEKNASAVLRLILFKQGTYAIKVTLETDEEAASKLSRYQY